MLNRQSLIAIGVAVLLGLIAVYLANVFLSSSEDRVAQAEAGTTRVAVAAVPLDYGVPLTPEKIRFVRYPTTSLPVGTFTRIEDLVAADKKRIALRPMAVNEPILASKVSGEGNASLAAILRDGMRAVSVQINAVSGVAGFIQPHDSVDVLITRSVGGREVTDVLLQDTRVIAIDQKAKNPNTGAADLARTATLEVDPIDAQKLALGQQVGSLSLVLRKPGEAQNNPVVETVSIEDLRYNLYGGSRYPQPAAGALLPRSQVTVAAAPAPPRRVVRRAVAPVRAAAPRPVTNDVEIVRGTVGQDYKVGGNGG